MTKENIPGYEGIYQIDTSGMVHSVERWVVKRNGKKQFVPAKVRKNVDHCTGYCVVRLSNGLLAKTYRVHRLVAEVFIPKLRDEATFVNHKNGDKKDNRVENLEWCTPLENIQHGWDTGLINTAGINNPSAKLTENNIADIHQMVLKGASLQEIAQHFSVSRNTVPKVLDREFGKQWRTIQKPQYRKQIEATFK